MKIGVATTSTLAGALALAGVLAVPAGAKAAVYTVTSDHCTGGCTPDASTITATDSGGNLLITVSLAPGDVFMTGPTGQGKNTFGFDLDLSSITISSSLTNPPWTTNNTANVNGSFTAGSFPMDGAGSYDYVMDIAGKGPSNISSLTFTILGASVADISGGSPFAADILSATTGNTGVVDFSISGGVPEPSTWAMLLLGFAGLGFAGYRKAQGGRIAPSVA
jgi:hypothetical protein